MAEINSGFVPVSSTVDNTKDYEGYTYSVAKDSPTNLGPIAPTIPANAFQLINKSPCPLKVTFTLQLNADKGGPVPPPTTKEIVYCPGETPVVKFDQDIIVDVTVEEAAAAPVDAITPDAGAAVVAAASTNIQAQVRFLNC